MATHLSANESEEDEEVQITLNDSTLTQPHILKEPTFYGSHLYWATVAKHYDMLRYEFLLQTRRTSEKKIIFPVQPQFFKRIDFRFHMLKYNITPLFSTSVFTSFAFMVMYYSIVLALLCILVVLMLLVLVAVG